MAESIPNVRTVLKTDNIKVADKVIEWLATEGIEAEVVLRPTASNEPIFGLGSNSESEEIEVRVTDEKRAEDAKKLISDTQRTALLLEIRNKRAERTGTVTVECEECHKSSDWPATIMGTTENCPHCQAYMDIPDPEDDWEGVDFGKAEDSEDQ